jgi:hypothetical protein
VKTMFKNQEPPLSEIDIEKRIKEIENQTLLVLREVKNAYEWDDIEDMVRYVDILKKIEKSFVVTLEGKEVDLLRKIFQKSVEKKRIKGIGLEKFIDVYKTFK